MTSITRDPLLAIAKGILWFLMGCMLVGAAGCLAAVPAMHIFQHEITIELAKEATPALKGQLLWACSGILLLSAALLLIVFRLFQLLKHIVDTVAVGDAFVPDNARRLTHMAWLTLALQLVTVPIGTLAVWAAAEFTKLGGRSDIDDAGFGISGNGLLLMLILFILARVFRQGAAMRAELEGTV